VGGIGGGLALEEIFAQGGFAKRRRAIRGGVTLCPRQHGGTLRRANAKTGRKGRFSKAWGGGFGTLKKKKKKTVLGTGKKGCWDVGKTICVKWQT